MALLLSLSTILFLFSRAYYLNITGQFGASVLLRIMWKASDEQSANQEHETLGVAVDKRSRVKYSIRFPGHDHNFKYCKKNSLQYECSSIALRQLCEPGER